MMFATKTETAAPARMREWPAVALILLIAATIRLWHVDFGLPALNDPDEPVFIMTALDMLREGRLNPGWFGHPATLLFYLLALVIVAVAGIGLALGQWAGLDDFVAAVFADPGIVVLPMRVAIVACGIVGVWLTWRIGRRVAGPAAGLIAALLLSVSALHVDLSQVIRTDMLASVLMGWCLLRALSIADAGSDGGRLRDHLWAGIAAGLAGATKWPALLVLIAPVLAGVAQARAGRAPWHRAAVAPLVAVATLLLASPYIALDWRTVLHDLGGEARPIHLGASGNGLFGNLYWYIRHPLLESFGGPGLALMAVGAAVVARTPGGRLVLLPTFALVLIGLSAHPLVWARWIVPLLPIAAIMTAAGLVRVATLPAARPARMALGGALLAVLLAGMASATLARQAARASDPRQAAAGWVRQNVPSGRTILVEHAAFDLLRYDGTLLFPLGTAGCVDVRRLLAAAPSHRRINTLREHRAIVDVGHVEPALLRSCAADVLILSNFARYRREADRFAPALANYRQLTAGHKRRFARAAASPDQRAIVVEVFVRRR